MTKKFGGLDVTKKIRHKDWSEKRAFIQLSSSSSKGMTILWYGIGEPYIDMGYEGGFKESQCLGWEYLEESEIEKAGLKDLDYGETIETHIKKIRDILIYLLEEKK